ncbi:MAG: DUF2877 domain-containing protein [Rhodospirillales bacterium]|nr:DUF2877 domain-containing protein [Rhodospirillales bacterium]
MSAELPSLPVVRMGSAARASLRAGMTGRVLAVFRRTFYVIDTEGGIVCIGDASLGAGPLNATCGSLHTNWRAGPLSAGDTARMADGILSIGNRLAFSLEGAPTWRPAPRPVFRGWPALRHGLQCLAEQARTEAPTDGLGRMIPLLAAGDITSLQWRGASPIAGAAAPGVVALWRWLSGRLGDPGERATAPAAAVSLLGMGPGLTPSGDDFLGGVAVALHALGRKDAAGDLAACLTDHLTNRTGLISGAHLRCALMGEASALTLEAMDALLSGQQARVLAAGRAAVTVGHTSGWDTLSGLVCAAASFVGAAAAQQADATAALCA